MPEVTSGALLAGRSIAEEADVSDEVAEACEAVARKAVAWLGGAAFVLSMAYGAATFRRRMGARAPAATSTLSAIATNLVLFVAFALHHSVAARPAVKREIARLIGASFERPAFVWTASGLFALVCRFWRPVPGQLWEVRGPAAMVFKATQVAGLVLTIWSARFLDPLELAGIPQLRSAPGGMVPEQTPISQWSPTGTLKRGGPYAVVRHPIYTGWALMVFATPHMTATRFVFAAASTAYLLVAMPLEERTLHHTMGAAYGDYVERVRWRIFPGVH